MINNRLVIAQGTHPDAPLSPKEAADLIGVSVRTLEKWRRCGGRLRYIVYRGRVWYKREWVNEFLQNVWL